MLSSNYTSQQVLRSDGNINRVNSQAYIKKKENEDMPYYMKQRQKNLIFASNSLEQISARSNSTSLVSYPPGFQPVKNKKAMGGSNALRSHYELSRVNLGVDGTGSSEQKPAEDNSNGSYQDTGYFGPRAS